MNTIYNKKVNKSKFRTATKKLLKVFLKYNLNRRLDSYALAYDILSILKPSNQEQSSLPKGTK